VLVLHFFIFFILVSALDSYREALYGSLRWVLGVVCAVYGMSGVGCRVVGLRYRVWGVGRCGDVVGPETLGALVSV